MNGGWKNTAPIAMRLKKMSRKYENEKDILSDTEKVINALIIGMVVIMTITSITMGIFNKAYINRLA